MGAFVGSKRRLVPHSDPCANHTSAQPVPTPLPPFDFPLPAYDTFSSATLLSVLFAFDRHNQSIVNL